MQAANWEPGMQVRMKFLDAGGQLGARDADPHPGSTPDGHVGFLDFGLLCEMEKNHKHAMLSSIVHIVNGDWASLVYDLTEIDVVPPRTNLSRVTMIVKLIIENLYLLQRVTSSREQQHELHLRQGRGSTSSTFFREELAAGAPPIFGHRRSYDDEF
ncbi:hypothetical protein ACQ4PT_000130 [Festuca glaucescens]